MHSQSASSLLSLIFANTKFPIPPTTSGLYKLTVMLATQCDLCGTDLQPRLVGAHLDSQGRVVEPASISLLSTLQRSNDTLCSCTLEPQCHCEVHAAAKGNF